MYEITLVPSASINLPCEFKNPPLYRLRHETNPQVMAQRLAQSAEPTVRDEIRVGAPSATTITMSPAAAAAIAPVQVPGMPGIAQRIGGQSAMRIQVTGPRPTLPITRVPQSQLRFRGAQGVQRRVPGTVTRGAKPAAAPRVMGVRATMQTRKQGRI